MIAQNYDALLCDAWGVIHNGVDLFPGVENAMVKFREMSGPVVILTNAPRPSAIIPAQLDRLGLGRHAYDAIVTSGDATRAEIIKNRGLRAFRLGPDKDDALYESTGVKFSAIEEADYIICTGLFEDQYEAPEDYRIMLKEAAIRNLPMICANPDIVVNWGGRIVYCAGALAEIYADEGGKVVFGGKPHAPIYDLAFSVIEEKIRKPIDLARILAIGDGIGTDIKGANNANIDVLFVDSSRGVSGNISDDENVSSAGVLAKHGVHAEYIMQDLIW